MEFNEEQLTVVKHVIFGLQRQANVINDAVVKIIARGIANFMGGAECMCDERTFADAVASYLNECVVQGSASDPDLVMLIAGEKSLAALNAAGPKIVTCDTVSDDSPKYNFRIAKLGQTLADNSYAVKPKKEAVQITGEYVKEDESYRAQAEKLKNDILAVAPEAMKAEINDNDYMLALCAAPYYFSM